MTEELSSEVEYKDGDIVWVKLSTRWWPGEVKDIEKLPEDVLDSFRKPPLVVVKFFDEDSYEFVKSWTHIYPYNCEKKNEFIKKGMDHFRAKEQHMEKFPKDVSTAEFVTQGNPNILSDPMFLPEQKTNYSALFFGTPPKKPKDGSARKGRPVKYQHDKKDRTHITHRRFLGFDDYEAHIRIQTPERHREETLLGEDEEDEAKEVVREEKQFSCQTCGFKTKLLEVIVLHSSSHIKGVYKTFTLSKRPTKSVLKKSKAAKAKRRSTDQGTSTSLLSLSSGDESERPLTKRKRKADEVPKSAKQKKVAEDSLPQTVDLRSDLLAEWDDDFAEGDMTLESSQFETSMETTGTGDESEQLETTVSVIDDSQSFTKESEKFEALPDDANSSVNDKRSDNKTVDVTVAITSNGQDKEKETSEKSKENKNKKVAISCFDFIEEEEQSSAMISPVAGRKIPRVIPPSERRKSESEDEMCSSGDLFPTGTDSSASALEDNDTKNKKSQPSEKDHDDLAFNDLLASTAVPDLPDIPNTLKCEQNFHCASTIKYPDKTDSLPSSESSQSCSKSTESSSGIKLIPKKRYFQSLDEHNKSAEAETPPETLKKANDFLDVGDTPEAAPNIESELAEAKEDSYEVRLENVMKQLPQDALECGDELEVTSQNVEINRTPFSSTETEETITKLSSLKSLDDEDIFDIPLAKMRKMTTSHRSPRKSNLLETYLNAARESDSEKLKLQSQQGTSLQNESDRDFTMSYDHKKMKYSKFSKALARQKVIESQDSVAKDPIITKPKEEACSKYESIFGEKSNTTSISSSVTSENNLPAPINAAKSADGVNVQKQSIKVSIPLQGTLDKDGSTDIKLPTKSFFPSQDTTNKSEGCSMKLLDMTGSSSPSPSPTSAANKDAPPLSDQKLSDTVIEDLFGDDNQKLLTEDIQSGMWNSESLSVTLSAPAKPEFSSTSELMMELADGEKSSSSEELKFKKDEPARSLQSKSNEGACSTAEIEKILENETHCEVLKPLKQDEFNKMESESHFADTMTASTVTISPDRDEEKSEKLKLNLIEDQVFSSDSLEYTSEKSSIVIDGVDKVEEESKVEKEDEDKVQVAEKVQVADEDRVEEKDKDKFEEEYKDRVEIEEALHSPTDEEKDELCELPSSEQVEKRTCSPDLFSQVSDIESNVYGASEEVKTPVEETRPAVEKTRESCLSPDLFSQGSSVGYTSVEVMSTENQKIEVETVEVKPTENQKIEVESSVDVEGHATESLLSSDIRKLEDDISKMEEESPTPDVSKKQDESEYVLVSNIEDTDVSNNVEVTTVGENDHVDESKSKHSSAAEEQGCVVSEEKADYFNNVPTKSDDLVFQEEPSTEKMIAVASECLANDQTEPDDSSALKKDIPFVKASSFFDEALGMSTLKSSSFTCPINDQKESDLGETIKTNLSTFSNNDELSALTTLAAVSELKDNLENNRSNALEEFKTLTSHTDTSLLPVSIGISNSVLSEKISKEFLNLPEKTKKEAADSDESRLLAAHEKALADSLMTVNSVDNSMSLSNFSMDYSTFSEESNSQEVAPPIEKSNSKSNTFTSITDSFASIPKTEKFNIQCAPKLIPKETVAAPAPAPTAICDLEDHIPPQIVCSKDKVKVLPLLKIKEITDSKSSRLLGILSDSTSSTLAIKRALMQKVKIAKPLVSTKSKPRAPKAPKPKTTKSKPIILSENIIKPADSMESVSVQKITSNSTYQDLEDIDTFIIQKNKPSAMESNYPPSVALQTIKSSGKAKILQQTIITPAGEIIQPNVIQQQTDDIMFDINSMPIVLSDGILTSEGMEKLPVTVQTPIITTPIVTTAVATTTQSNNNTPVIKKAVMQVAVPSKSTSQSTPLQAALTRAIAQTKAKMSPKIPQSKMIKQAVPLSNSTSSRTTGKYVIMPTALQQESKAMAPKKQYSAKKVQSITPHKTVPVTPEPAKNRVMVFTHPSSGEKQRLLITPEQQKLIAERKKFTGTVIKGGLVPQKTVLKNQLIQLSSGPGHSVAVSAARSVQNVAVSAARSVQNVAVAAARSVQNVAVATTVNQVTPMTSGSQASSQTVKNVKIDMKGHKKVVQFPNQRVQVGQPAIQKTVLLKNQSGHTRKYHSSGADKSLLDQQVAEQVEAIKISQAWAHQKSDFPSSKLIKPVNRRSYTKSTPDAINQSTASRIQTNPMKAMSIVTDSSIVPPLNPLTTRKTETITKHTMKQESKKPKEIPVHQSKPVVAPAPPQAPQVNQIVIQDQLGNQTPVAVGQILALPSETVDGQPHSYILVTVDEAGNFTPLSSDALMSLDPSLGSDIGNMFMNYDTGSISSNQTAPASAVQIKAAAPATEVSLPREKTFEKPKLPAEKSVTVKSSVQRDTAVKAVMPEVPVETIKQPVTVESPLMAPAVQQMPVLEPGQQQQQLVVTGDPEATKKFLESLSDGTTDLSSILANAEGGSIVIQTDGQQIIINTDPNNQSMMIPGMSGNVNVENCEGSGNPMFSSQPKKTTDILAAALAGTDVFQQDHHSLKGPSQLSPNSTLYPMNVGNVLEPTLTLSSPIMTPLEVPSNNSKKVPDNEADILTHVPKNVDLPITITDPNISQTVAQQQVASLIASELQSNLELLTTETSVLSTVASSSDSYSYSLPTFDDDTIELSSKSFNSSMPLLTEDGENLSSASTVLADKIDDLSKEEEIKDVTATSQIIETDDHCPISLSLKDEIEVSTSSAEMGVNALEIPGSCAEISTSSTEVASSSLELPKSPEDISRNPVEIPESPSEIPTSSAEILTSSEEILTSATEILTSPAEILTSSEEILTSATEILTSPAEIMTSSAEILTSSTEILTTPAEILTSSTEILTSSTEILTSSTEILTSSTEVLTSSTEILTSPAEILTNSAEILTSSTEVLTSSTEVLTSPAEGLTSPAEIMTSSAEIMTSCEEILTSSAEISTSSVESLISAAEIPTSSVEIPISSAEILTSSTEILTSCIETPVSCAEIPTSSVEMQISDVEIPTSSVEISVNDEEIRASACVVEIPTSSVEISTSSTEAPKSPAEIAEISTSSVEIPRSPVEFHRSLVEMSPIPDKQLTLSPSIHSEDSGDEGLCTLGGEMCNSLSEPPPDMFELDTLTEDDRMSSSIFSGSSFNLMSNEVSKRDDCASNEPSENESSLEREAIRTKVSRIISADELKPDSTSSTDFHNEDSCEIPILPPIVTTIVSDESSNSGSDKNIFRDKV